MEQACTAFTRRSDPVRLAMQPPSRHRAYQQVKPLSGTAATANTACFFAQTCYFYIISNLSEAAGNAGQSDAGHFLRGDMKQVHGSGDFFPIVFCENLMLYTIYVHSGCGKDHPPHLRLQGRGRGLRRQYAGRKISGSSHRPRHGAAVNKPRCESGEPVRSIRCSTVPRQSMGDRPVPHVSVST